MNTKKFNFVYITICKENGKCYVGSHCTDKEDLDFNQYYGGGLYFLYFCILQYEIKLDHHMLYL